MGKRQKQVLSPSKRLWRTLVRVTQVDRKEGLFWVVIPGANFKGRVGCPISFVPPRTQKVLRRGRRLHVQMNLGAESYREVVFGKWESR